MSRSKPSLRDLAKIASSWGMVNEAKELSL